MVYLFYAADMASTLIAENKPKKKKKSRDELWHVNGQPAARTDCLEEDHLSTSQLLLGS